MTQALREFIACRRRKRVLELAAKLESAGFRQARSTLIAQLCIRHELVLLTTDADFEHIASTHP